MDIKQTVCPTNQISLAFSSSSQSQIIQDVKPQNNSSDDHKIDEEAKIQSSNKIISDEVYNPFKNQKPFISSCFSSEKCLQAQNKPFDSFSDKTDTNKLCQIEDQMNEISITQPRYKKSKKEKFIEKSQKHNSCRYKKECSSDSEDSGDQSDFLDKKLNNLHVSKKIKKPFKKPRKQKIEPDQEVTIGSVAQDYLIYLDQIETQESPELSTVWKQFLRDNNYENVQESIEKLISSQKDMVNLEEKQEKLLEFLEKLQVNIQQQQVIKRAMLYGYFLEVQSEEKQLIQIKELHTFIKRKEDSVNLMCDIFQDFISLN